MTIALGKSPAAIPAQLEFGLHAPNHDGIELVAVRCHGAGKTLAVEQLQQGGEALAVAVVRGGGKEQLVLEMRAERANGQGALGVGGVLAAARRRDVVRLIDDHQIVGPRVGRLVACRQRLAESAQGAFALEEVDRGDQPREMRPGIDVDAALAAQAG